MSVHAKVASQIHQACRDVGFFHLKVDERFITSKEMKTVLDAGREFFVLPQEEKGKIGISKGDGSRGESPSIEISTVELLLA